MLTSKEFKNVATQFRNTSSDAKNVETSLRNAIEQQTVKEKGALDIALKNYQAAVKREMDTKENKERVKKLKSYSDHMEKTLDKCFSAFEQTVKAIQESNDSDKIKLQKINQTAEFVMGQLFTEDERQMFGEMEMTFPMKVTLPLKRLNFPNSSLSCNLTSFFIKNEVQLLSSRERSIKYQ